MSNERKISLGPTPKQQEKAYNRLMKIRRGVVEDAIAVQDDASKEIATLKAQLADTRARLARAIELLIWARGCVPYPSDCNRAIASFVESHSTEERGDADQAEGRMTVDKIDYQASLLVRGARTEEEYKKHQGQIAAALRQAREEALTDALIAIQRSPLVEGKPLAVRQRTVAFKAVEVLKVGQSHSTDGAP